jgi:phage repressor protein C with HTH and peptisase S24 domain
MGATYLDVPITQKLRYFDKDWLGQHTRAAPESLIFAQGMGDSMEPTIHDSDLLLIDTSQRRLNMADKIWAVAYANCGAVKRLRPRADGGVVMASDNPLVGDQIAYDGEMQLLGRVVAIVRKM